MPPWIICQLLLWKESVCFARHRRRLRPGSGTQPQAIRETDKTRAPSSLTAHLLKPLTFFPDAVSRDQANGGSQHLLSVTCRASQRLWDFEVLSICRNKMSKQGYKNCVTFLLFKFNKLLLLKHIKKIFFSMVITGFMTFLSPSVLWMVWSR